MSSNRQSEALELQAEIQSREREIGTKSLALGPYYRQMHDQRLYQPLGYKSFDDWIDEESTLSRSRVYDIIHTWTQLEGSFPESAIGKMVYENARVLVEAFQDNVPERFQTPAMVKALHESSNAQFRRYLNTLMPGLKLEKRWTKTFQLSQSQHGIIRHAINKIKKEHGAVSDAEAIEDMAQSVILEGVQASELGPIVDLLHKIEAIEVDRSLRGTMSPTAEQWNELVKLAAGFLSSLLDTQAVG